MRGMKWSLALVCAASFAGCSGTSTTTQDGGPSDSGFDAGPSDSGFDAGLDAGPSDSGFDAGFDGGMDAGVDGGLYTVTFSYTPQWSGVVSVGVLGGFGQSNDWSGSNLFLALADDGTGTWTGSAQLAAGTYLYVYKIVGDSAAGSRASTSARYSIDNGVSAFAACPAASPTYSTNMNPCSQLTVPQSSPDATFHIRGTAVADGGAAPSWVILLERDEMSSHHFFANRADSDASGNFDLVAAPGHYRVQVQHPTILSLTDQQRVPPSSQFGVKRLLTGSFNLASDVQLDPAEVHFDGTEYAAMQPNDGGGALPQTFSFPLVPPATQEYVAVYGGSDGGLQNIGDPWWRSQNTASGSATFDGGFTTQQATEANVKLGEKYFWGVWLIHPRGSDGGTQWTGESMVWPVVFQ